MQVAFLDLEAPSKQDLKCNLKLDWGLSGRCSTWPATRSDGSRWSLEDGSCALSPSPFATPITNTAAACLTNDAFDNNGHVSAHHFEITDVADATI